MPLEVNKMFFDWGRERILDLSLFTKTSTDLVETLISFANSSLSTSFPVFLNNYNKYNKHIYI